MARRPSGGGGAQSCAQRVTPPSLWFVDDVRMPRTRDHTQVSPLILMKKLALVAALVLAAPSLVVAQSNASHTVGASAVVLSPLQLLAGRDLAFGRVGQGVAKMIGVDSATSGRFELKGNGHALVGVTITLPTTLMNAAFPMPIGSWTGAFTDVTDAAAGFTFVPATGTRMEHRLPGTVENYGQSRFYRLGATVTPGGAQAPGTYIGTIGIAALYLEM